MTCGQCDGEGKLYYVSGEAAYRCTLCNGKGVLHDKPPGPTGSASNPGTPIVGYVLANRTLYTFEDNDTMQQFLIDAKGAWSAAACADRHVHYLGRVFVSVNPDVPSPAPSDWDLMEAES